MGLDHTVRSAYVPGSLSKPHSSKHSTAHAGGVKVSSTSLFEGDAAAL